MRLSLGISSCPNDIFIFDAMIHGKVDTEGLSFDLLVADVEELNRKAFNALNDVTKLSYHAYPLIAENYILLNSGSALGRGNGPLLIGKKKFSSKEIAGLKIAIPGKLTTANMLFSIFYPDAARKLEFLFSDIEDAILAGEVEAGVIIHESRFTYQEKGLEKLADLGEMWEKSTGLPIPLGGIAAKRELGEQMLQKIDRVVHRSTAFALANRDSSREFVKFWAKELDDHVIGQHIDLYVNQYTLNLNNDGKEAVHALFEKAVQTGHLSFLPEKIFVE